MKNQIINIQGLNDNQDIVFSYLTVPNSIRIKVEPVTIAALVSAALDYIKSKNTLKWQSDVSGALAEISAKLDVIILEIQKLRLYFDQRITRETLIHYQSEVEARRVAAEEIISGISEGGALPDETKQRLVGLLDGMSLSLRQLMNWQHFNFDAYQAVLAGVI